MNEKTHLRTTFDRDASLYQQARPGYPAALFDDIIEFSGIPADGRVLEIGCGTGQATLPLAQRGYAIQCIELGVNLAAVAAQNLSPYPKVQVSVGNFEEYPLARESFNLVISATAFHWIDPEIGYPKVAESLKPAGAIALFWNKPVQTQRSAGFFNSVQDVYREIVPEMAKGFKGLPHPDTIALPVTDEMEHSGLFGDVDVRKYGWVAEYTSESYIRVLNTYSDHLALEDAVRARLFAGIKNLIETEFNGQVVKEHLSILYLAHRKD